MTGLYPSANHNNRNGSSHFELPYRARLITRHLANAGYRCGLAGKLHLSAAWSGLEERGDDVCEDFSYSVFGIHHFGGLNDYGCWLRSNGK